jgi:tRNA G18 (ribose-2'-O)-methylase SpoU
MFSTLACRNLYVDRGVCETRNSLRTGFVVARRRVFRGIPPKGAPDVTRGFYGIGIVGAKTPINVGTLWRSSAILGASFMFTAGRRYPKQGSDTIKAWRHIPYFEYESAEDLFDHIPKDCVPVAVELHANARALPKYTHPERAIYILGAEDGGVPKRVLERCRDIVQIPGTHCLNVATAGTVVLYDRVSKSE